MTNPTDPLGHRWRRTAAIIACALWCVATVAAESEKTVEQWGVFEAAFAGPEAGNPFVDVQFAATFRQGETAVAVNGFYDGGGTYRLRFMPPTPGAWRFTTRSNGPALDGQSGAVTVSAPSPANHGPVRVRDAYRFAYADGTPFREVGTTCYAWAHQSEALQRQTLRTLAAAPFNKLRMCVFPKWYDYNRREPALYPFEGTPPNHWDFTRLNPAYFQHLERRIADLRDLGIQADLILFHPYDEGHWGFDQMGAASDDRYLRYAVARFGAYRNVWWSLANEWDLCKAKTAEDWDRFGQIIRKEDPAAHLCSIHQIRKIYDPSRPWLTHVSFQNDRPEDAPKLLAQYNKPLIYDECRYEGDIPHGWGDITPERMTSMFWKTLVGGAWCGHGETYVDPQDVLWWSHGGTLHGQSPARIAFFKQVIGAAPADAGPIRGGWGVEGRYYLTYLYDRQRAVQTMTLPEGGRFKGDVIDTWAMTITPVPGVLSGKVEIPLPRGPYFAVRVQAVEPN